MKHDTIIRFRRFSIRPATVLSSLALALTLSAPALAGHKSHKHRHGHHHHPSKVVHRVDTWRPLPPPPPRARHFVVPQVIRTGYVEAYRPYYRGYAHYAPHGHAHAVYAFPAWRNDVLFYEPRYYCGGELFVGNHVAYSGPHVSFHIAF